MVGPNVVNQFKKIRMKLKIKVKVFEDFCKLEVIKKGDWIDLRAAKNVTLKGPIVEDDRVMFQDKKIPLGIAMELPKFFEANVLPRSSTFNKFGITLTNSKGVIDASYCGDNDQWGFGALAYRNTTIHKGDRIAQFRIRPNQFAPIMVKLRWLFTSKIEFIYVDKLKGQDRGGYGSTGIK